ncbi:hypothetical protein ACTOB_002509 [Actinoplanes oblitus]|uniref:Uncharacterized protein n=1 Tax=Actinoplanes oblitus TaxID=3040509 RepID=A0ABY8WLX0_9ACTN|nr:hypothetical protein [Actinoplanes oblitus]WIM98889.1 hypothetical protein ACTOB_002509 [Actinoplanes oblitus]
MGPDRSAARHRGRLFLVPARWTGQGRPLVVPYDDEVRIRLVPAR